ncbi:hypothetical protein OHT52_21325 [Streptomyces sp. NBC_00247]|uniref:hypothetical protein n=1 Tax=Streptomyces sp. NBC_00247 TaxID=2975689 RepID=UPI002E2AE4A6|nr:hypothetical protein [Streptomyces sp. NBC_00247]
MPDKTTISAPIPVGVRPIPGGARLLLDVFAQAVIEDVLGALLSTDADSDLYDRLVTLAEMMPEESAAAGAEGRMPFEELVTDLADRASKHTHLYGERGLQLAEQVLPAAVRSLPVGHWAADAWRAYGVAKTEAEHEAAAVREAVSGGAAA